MRTKLDHLVMHIFTELGELYRSFLISYRDSSLVEKKRKKEIADCRRVRQRCYKIWPTCDYNTDRQDKCLKCQENILKWLQIHDCNIVKADGISLSRVHSFWRVFWKYEIFLPNGYRILFDWHMTRNGYQHKPLSNG